MKKFLIFSNYSKDLKLIECENISNDLLFIKYNVSENDLIKLNDNQNIVIVEKGKIVDIKDKNGIYEIKEIQEEKNDFDKLVIKKAENEDLCVIFLNTNEIKDNKYYIKNPIEYIDWSYEEEPLVAKIKVEGRFNFQIIDPVSFLENMVIGLRTHYSKQELIEQIRPYIINSIEKGINEISNEYKININEICEKSKELEIKVSTNNYDKKLLEKGIKINYFDIERLEVDNDVKYPVKDNKVEDKKICENCGAVLEIGDTFCKICGTLNNFKKI